MMKFYAIKNASVLENLKFYISKTMLGKIKQNGKVYVCGKSCKMSYIVEIGEEIYVEMPNKTKETVAIFDAEIKVLYEDLDIIVLEKPSGMQTHCSRSDNKTTLENAYCGMVAKSGGDIKNFTFHAITRLDKETSGAVLICKNPISTAKLSGDMKSGKIKKGYTAVANGDISQDFIIDINMDRVDEYKPHRWQCENGKQSKTIFHVIKRLGKSTVVKAIPITGRTHQIRVHLAFCGHAIVGDKLYDNGKICDSSDKILQNTQENAKNSIDNHEKSRLMLHCAEIEFYNMQGEKITVYSPFLSEFA